MPDEIMCEDLFERLAKDDPGRLIGLMVDGDMKPTDLTFACEYAGRIRGEWRDEAERVLLDLACHRDPLIREGAEIGLDAIAEPRARW